MSLTKPLDPTRFMTLRTTPFVLQGLRGRQMKRLFLWALLTRLCLSDGEKGLSIGSRSVPAFVRACVRACPCSVRVTLVFTSALVLPVLPVDFPSVLEMNACVHVYISTHAY